MTSNERESLEELLAGIWFWSYAGEKARSFSASLLGTWGRFFGSSLSSQRDSESFPEGRVLGWDF